MRVQLNILIIARIIAVLATAATGLLALIKPAAAYEFTGLNPTSVRGVSEIRAIFGGLFIGLDLSFDLYSENQVFILIFHCS